MPTFSLSSKAYLLSVMLAGHYIPSNYTNQQMV